MGPIQGYLRSNNLCGVCGHALPHKYDVLGKTECKDCPGEFCIPKEAQAVSLDKAIAAAEVLGFSIIGQMTRAALIDEILAHQRIAFEQLDAERLRRLVIEVRS